MWNLSSWYSVTPAAETQIRGPKHSGSWWPDFKAHARLQLRWWSLWGLASYQSWEPANRSTRRCCYAGRAASALPQPCTRGGPGPRGSSAPCHTQPYPCYCPLPTRHPQRATQKEVCQRSLAGQETHSFTTHLTNSLKLLTLRLLADTSGTVTWWRWSRSLLNFQFFFTLLIVIK